MILYLKEVLQFFCDTFFIKQTRRLKRILVILIFCIANQVFASNLTDWEYFSQINRAENYVVANRLNQAKLVYDKVFQTYANPFFKDVLVSAVIDVKLNKYDELTQKKIIYLFKKGYSYKRFHRHSVLKGIPNKEKNKLKVAYKIHKDELVDIELRAQIHELFTEDQKIRSRIYSFFLKGRVSKKDSIIHSKYMELTKCNGGYIGENIIGISGYSLASSESYILALHYDSDTKNELGFYLSAAIKTGHIHPLYYAAIIDRRRLFSGEMEQYGTSLIWGRKISSNENKLMLDENRKQIGLDSINEHQQKIRNNNGVHLIYLN